MPLIQSDGTSTGEHSTDKQSFHHTVTMDGESFACVKALKKKDCRFK